MVSRRAINIRIATQNRSTLLEIIKVTSEITTEDPTADVSIDIAKAEEIP